MEYKNNSNSKYNEAGINKATYELLFSDKEKIINFDEMDKEEKIKDYIFLVLDRYTRFREKSIFTSLLKKYFGANLGFDFSKIVWNEKNEEYELEYLGEKYTFNKLSNLIEDKKGKKELESKKRYGKCHTASLGMSLGLEDVKVLTGYSKRGGGKYLHSVIETSNGKIVDWTRNIVMPKEEFIRLTGFTVLETLEKEEIKQIFLKFSKKKIDNKVLSVFGRELLKDINRNPSFFEDDENIKTIISESNNNNYERN